MLSAVTLFVLAALAGLILAAKIFRGTTPPLALALVHGALAAIALVLSLLLVLGAESTPLARLGVVVLIIAALGGFFLFSFHLRGKPHPRAVVVLHAVLAAAGLGCLVLTLI